jgi:hypothetical protein
MLSSSATGLEATLDPQVRSRPQTMNYPGVGVAAVVAFVASGLWYSPVLLGTLYVQVRGADAGTMSPGEIVVELLRSLIVAYVLAHFVNLLGVRDRRRALRFGIWVWIGFPCMILLGAVAHENVPLPLAAIHAGDWLVKVVIMTLIPSVWRTQPG